VSADGPGGPILDGHHWYPNGQSVYSGKALRLSQRLDRQFLGWAAELDAEEFVFPTFIPAAELQKLDYLSSFQHLATFPVNLKQDDENLKRFGGGEIVGEDGGIRLTETAPIKDILTPAACYHFYNLFQGTRFDGPRFLTTRNTCFRREVYYRPFERQWSFSMREIVCIGTEEQVTSFLERCGGRVASFLHDIQLPVRRETATDPFFNPAKNAKYLAQRMAPLKNEFIFGETLAIGSVNFHRQHFGEAFDLTAADAEPAFSGCVAFGVDRWVYAFTKTFGDDESRWPLPPLEGSQRVKP
jgi:seryl-tRNA synthetase